MDTVKRMRSLRSAGTATDLPAPKRISTPAGMRLSVIMNERTQPESQTAPPRESLSTIPNTPTTPTKPPKLSFSKGGGVIIESDTTNLSSPGYSSFSEKDIIVEEANESQEEESAGPKPSRKRRRRWLLAASAILLLVIVLAVGLGVGLKKKSSSKPVSSPPDSASESTADSDSEDQPPSPLLGTPHPAQPLPKDFPLGTFSMVTFLDTVQANCTSNPSTWTCSPGTIYNSNPEKAMSSFDWVISAGSSDNSYAISSKNSDDPSGISLKNVPLRLVEEGKSTERYVFRTTVDKVVNVDKGTTCFFNGTTFQGYLYTKRARDYPLKDMTTPSGSEDQWPFAVRAEQVVGGGDNTPNCYKTGSDGQLGDKINKGTEAQDAGSLCSCLYKNWRTPT